MWKPSGGTNPSRSPVSPLWAITAYFDPFGCGHRLRVFREFRRRLGVPLIAAELAFDDRFDLGPEDADILIRVHGGSVMWQKERLLSLAVAALPPHVECVMWADCDTVFLREDWPRAAMRRLEHFEMIQPFRRLHYLAPGEIPDRFRPSPDRAYDSAAFRFANSSLPEETFGTHGLSQCLRYAPGMAWAARRATLESCGIYDAAVLGAGDKLTFAAAAGRAGYAATGIRMGAAHRAHYCKWAERFWGAVRGRISYIEGDLLHLWHGDLAGRRYRERYLGFEHFDFDPEIDLALTRDGVWRWNSAKPDLHEFVLRQMELIQPVR